MVKVLNKALALIEVLSNAASGDGMGVSDLGRELQLDKATVFRLLRTLRDSGYVDQDSSTGRYKLTLKLWSVGSRLVNQRTLTQVARPVLRELSATVGETVYISVLVGKELIILDKIEARDAMLALPRIGGRLPLHGGSSGKAILAFQDPAFITSVCAHLQPVTADTITESKVLLAQLAEIRKSGYAINQNELRVGVSGTGAPIRTEDGNVTAALSISGPSVRLPRRRLKELAKLVVQAASRISAELGGH